jgi:Mg-chelatase subunit ChlI
MKLTVSFTKPDRERMEKAYRGEYEEEGEDENVEESDSEDEDGEEEEEDSEEEDSEEEDSEEEESAEEEDEEEKDEGTLPLYANKKSRVKITYNITR